MNIDKARESFREAADALASEMANRNNVEAAWQLRGVIDSLLGEYSRNDANDEGYGSEYRYGYRNAHPFRGIGKSSKA